ncbi:MAG: carbohydrate kinase, partial [Thermotogaceae bacterium]|nr:carbohydrate kinase [Thermotogaceae bacterium]
LKEVPAGSLGLIVQPYWTPGLKMPEAKGAMIGFGSAHRKPHMYKAIIEGLGFALLEGLRKIEKRGKIKVKEIMIAGGASQSTEICQIVTDIFNLPAYRGETHETAGLGSTIPVFVGLGVHKTFEEAVSKMVRYRDKFEPDPENARLYRRIFEEVYSRMYSKLKPLYKKIREITNYPEKI